MAQRSALGDPRLLEKPSTYSGAIEQWRAWRLRMLGWLSGVDGLYTPLLAEAEARSTVITRDEIPANLARHDAFLYSVFLELLRGEAMKVAAGVTDISGFEVWRRLASEAKRAEKDRSVATMERLLHPQFGPASGWRTAWLT